MGNSTSFFVYGRVEETDKYAPELLTIEGGTKVEAMSLFKHLLFSWALKKKHGEMRCLYLYQGPWRVAKVSRAGGKRLLECRTLADKVMWYECEEKLPPTYWPSR